ncbi:hypothetical protein C5167_042768 [Papaver somniferum]|uniref:Uncharacterized protein n=1 Tax=Papaver somniferum TaxID=3469 RepID=A0A4Y7L4S4_PAPSO|nr:hypothetical protein C5167_042768 [Papaver somniferum]
MAAAAAEGLIRCVFEGCISTSDTDIERRPYHKNCNCALHRSSSKSSSAAATANCNSKKKLSYPIRRSWSEGCLALAAGASSSNNNNNNNNNNSNSSSSCTSPVATAVPTGLSFGGGNGKPPRSLFKLVTCAVHGSRHHISGPAHLTTPANNKELTADFKVSESINSRARIEEPDSVCLWSKADGLWSRADVVLEYTSTTAVPVYRQSGQNLSQHPNAQATKLQFSDQCIMDFECPTVNWDDGGFIYSYSFLTLYVPHGRDTFLEGRQFPDSLSTAAAVPGSSTTAATTPALAPIGGQGEKPEELTLFEQRHQQKPPAQGY